MSVYSLAPLFLLALPAVSGTVVLGTSTAAPSLAALGLVKLKTAALLALRRSKRQADTEEVNSIRQEFLFQQVEKLEQSKCVQRFLCEVATTKLTAPDFVPAVKLLVAEDLEQLVESSELNYSVAVKSGANSQSIEKCQAKFSCPRTGGETQQALALYGA